MSARLSRKLARLAFTAGFACTATLLLTTAGSAATRTLSGTHSAGEVAGTCLKSGGTFTSNANGSYRCDGNGGSLVSCDAAGKCTGTCAKCAAVSRGVNGVLRPPLSAGTATSMPNRRSIPVASNSHVPVAGIGHVGNSGSRKH